MLKFLEFKRTEMSTKYGPGHPDMVSLNRQIDAIKKDIADRGGPADDELGRHRRKLENETRRHREATGSDSERHRDR